MAELACWVSNPLIVVTEFIGLLRVASLARSALLRFAKRKRKEKEKHLR
jgi:hypothetical protein